MILAPAVNRTPDELIIWGVGLTESDVELVELYRQWARHTKRISIINPSQTVAKRATDLLGVRVGWFDSVQLWESAVANDRVA